MDISELHLSEVAFERFYKTHFDSLYAYAFSMLRDEAMAEEMVQQVFYKVWEKRKTLNVHTSVKAFLYKSVYFECLNYLKHQKHKVTHQNYISNIGITDSNRADALVELNELERRLQIAMNELPEQHRSVFQMSRFEELTYREIAEQLGMSVKTVEAHMSKVLKVLRTKLADFLPMLIAMLIEIKEFH